jgi:predicted outer membrane repeat protein
MGSRWKHKSRSGRAHTANRRRLRLEPLEDRRLLAALLVNSPLDNTVAGDGFVTLREAILAANSDTTTDLGHKGNFADTISFDFGHDGPQTIELTMGQLTIGSDLSIVGAGSHLLTIDASGSDTMPDVDNGTGSRVFDISLRPIIGWNVTLRKMTLTGGDTNGRGGAIQAAGHLMLDDVSIVGNFASNHGGAIYTTHRLNVSDSEIVDNHSRGSGGGIHVVGSQSLLLSNAHIAGNTSAFDGGGLFVDDSDFTIVHSTITDNHADPGPQFRGGGIYVRDTTILAAEAVITANDAGSGGGIYALRSRLTFNDSQINQNEALAGDGGGIYIDATPIGVALNSSTMTGNKSSQDGGAIYGRNSLASVNDSIISGNEAESRAGGVFVRNDALRVVRSRITGNVADGNGGGLVSYTVSSPTASMYVADSAVDNNESGGSGGGIYTYRIFASTISRSTLHTNTANWGGAISARETMSLAVIDSTLSGNDAVTSGGAVIAQRSGVSLQRSTVTGNRANSDSDGKGEGGGIIAYDGSSISLGHTILAGNHDPSNLGPDLHLFPNINAPTLSATFSLIGDNRGTNLTEAPVGSPNAAGNLIGGPMNGVIDPQLGPLTYNGGPVLPDGSPMFTHALIPGSPAIDAGDPAAMAGTGIVPLYDQRGMPFSRVADGDDIPESRIDIGAFEWQPNTLPGDFNYSGVVDAADCIVWRKTLGSIDDLRADGDVDGDIDQDDYAVWRANFGAVAASPPAASAVALQHPGSDVESGTDPQTRMSFDTPARTISRRSESLPVAPQRTDEASASNDEALLAWLAGKTDGVGLPQSSIIVALAGEESQFLTDNWLPLDVVFAVVESDGL